MSLAQNHAVFLSYASQDAAAVQGLCDALRAAGVEVWFDQNELRGGDEWDRKIKQQIRDCALFVPVISAATQARPEGYFRLEWHLAEQRSLLIAKGRPFLVPIVLDATPQSGALVPDVFQSFQWTRLAGPEALPALVKQVQRLLELRGRPTATPTPEPPPSPGLAAEANAARRPVIPDYEVLRIIGRGSYGDVWLARGTTGIYRAVKVVWRDRFENDEPYEREFRGLREFAAISLATEGQLAVLHLGRNDAGGYFYYVMELADDAEGGRTFDPANYVPLTFRHWREKRGRIPAAEVIAAGAELAGALAALHRRGLVHRDIKPSNIVFVQGRAKLADIGLVTTTGEAHTFIGTSGYVPPEGPGAPAADVFALGRVLYELSTGRDREEFPKLPADLERLPDAAALFELNEVLLRAGAAVAENRYRDATELAADLRSLAAGQSLRAVRGKTTVGRRRAWVALGAVAAVGLAFWVLPSRPDPAAVRPVSPSSLSPSPSSARAPLAAAPAKSVAVLPLENLSPDPANAFFADGLHQEIIATITRLGDLRVTPRTTMQGFRGTTLSPAEIARKLAVANVLSGSVRREGLSVRVQLELRRAVDEAVVWQKTYDRQFAQGFAIQDEIATDVARILQVRESAGWYAGAKFMTKNPEAYDLFLKARELPAQKGPSKTTFDEQIRLAEAAVQLDPEFMSAASLLASAYAYRFQGAENADQRRELAANAKRWAERAAQLVPGGAGDGALSVYYSMVEQDAAQALVYAQNELRALPGDPNGHNRVAMNLEDFGRFTEALAGFDRALELDPLNVRVLHNRVICLAHLRRPAEFERAALQNLELGGRNVDRGMIEEFRFRLTGQPPVHGEGPAASAGPARRAIGLWYQRKFPEALKMAELAIAEKAGSTYNQYQVRRVRAGALQKLGRLDELAAAAREMLDFAESRSAGRGGSEAESMKLRIWGLTFSGDRPEALKLGRYYVAEAAGPAKFLERWFREEDLALVHAWFGQKAECVEILKRLVQVPSSVTVPYLRHAPDWESVRDDPGFQSIINDPKNSEPL